MSSYFSCLKNTGENTGESTGGFFLFKGKGIVIGFLILLDLTSCKFSSSASGSSANVSIAGVLSSTLNRRVYRNSQTRSLICRQTPLTNRNARRVLENNSPCGKLDTSHKIIEDTFPLEEEETEATLGAAGSETDNDPVRVGISGNFLRLGLKIANNTDNYLIIHTLTWVATAELDDELLEAGGVIDSGYCSDIETNSERGGVSFLYFIPPVCGSNYTQYGGVFDNLTIYLEGFELIDRRERDAARLAAASGGTEGGVSGGSVQGVRTEDIFFRSGIVFEIPSYTVTLSFEGNFLDADNKLQGEFYTQFRFTTEASTIP